MRRGVGSVEAADSSGLNRFNRKGPLAECPAASRLVGSASGRPHSKGDKSIAPATDGSKDEARFNEDYATVRSARRLAGRDARAGASAQPRR